MKGGDHLIPTGRFAELSRLSLKALRIYDRLGLLRPVHVDHRTRYRYYHRDQAAKARVIVLLRRLEVPLELIREILESDGTRAVDLLRGYWREVEERTREGRQVVAYLEEILGGGTPMEFAVNTREGAGTQALSVMREVYVKDLPGFIEHSIRLLYRRTADQGGRISGHPTVIYHGEVNEDSNGPVEVCLPVERGTVTGGDEIRLVELPGGSEAYTTITEAQCRFPEILRAYDAVHAWITRNGRTAAGPPREIYFSDPARSGAGDPFCDIVWPIRREGT